MLIGTASFANGNVISEINTNLETENVVVKPEIEKIYTEYAFKDDHCYVRWCWNPTENTKKCTDWQEVPCDTNIKLEQKTTSKKKQD